MIGNELLDLAGNASFSYAVSLGSVSLVNAVGSIQPIVVLVLASLLRVREPHIGHETHVAQWTRTVFAVLLAAIGLALLRYSN